MKLFFAMPDLSNPLDISIVTLVVAFLLIAGLANRVDLPFLTRGGGLLSYSKFAKDVTFGIFLPSRLGMLTLYFPSVMIAYVMLQGMQDEAPIGSRQPLVAQMMIAHFGKRSLECLLLHKYSGSMPLASSLFITSLYSTETFAAVHYAGLVEVSSYVSWWLPAGLALFGVGLAGNFYHHWLLATLRKPGEKGYKVPRGGGFEYVAAPHYFFELVGWLGVAVVSQHILCVGFFVAMATYLTDRAMAQSEWNNRKLDNYPKARKHIVPFVF